MTTRFDLEQEIMKCWSVVDDIDVLYHSDDMSEDERQNYLLGLKTIYQVKFEKLWTVFEQCVQNGTV